MSAIKWDIEKPRKLTLAFDEPLFGEGINGKWIKYGIKNGDLSSEEDCFWATDRLHAMNQTLGAKGGDEITIEKFPPEEGMKYPYFKVNGLSIDDMNKGGSVQKKEEVKQESSDNRTDLEMELAGEIVKLKKHNKLLQDYIDSSRDSQVTDADIPC